FTSRRRHTRFSRDWSSDVCSSDLTFLKFPNAFSDFETVMINGYFVITSFEVFILLPGKFNMFLFSSFNFNRNSCSVRFFTFFPRSEERRVGKGRRSLCARDTWCDL